MTDSTKATIAELEASVERLIGYDRREQLKQVLDESLVDWANVRELVRRYRTLLALAREANRGGLAGADGLSALTSWRLAQPIEPEDLCPECGGGSCATCRGTGRR